MLGVWGLCTGHDAHLHHRFLTGKIAKSYDLGYIVWIHNIRWEFVFTYEKRQQDTLYEVHWILGDCHNADGHWGPET